MQTSTRRSFVSLSAAALSLSALGFPGSAARAVPTPGFLPTPVANTAAPAGSTPDTANAATDTSVGTATPPRGAAAATTPGDHRQTGSPVAGPNDAGNDTAQQAITDMRASTDQSSNGGYYQADSWGGIAIATLVAILIILFAPELSPWISLIIGLVIAVADQLIGDWAQGRVLDAFRLLWSRLPWWLRF